MKLKYIPMAMLLLTMGSCSLYRPYELPTDRSALVEKYSREVAETPDSTSLPYLGWREVFTDPQLQDLITRALASNTNLEKARLNVETARAQLEGARLSYYPSLTLSPNIGTASYGGSDMKLAYTIPAAANWEVDIFGKLLNAKRSAKVAVEQSEDYRQAVQSQIVCGVASTYYALVLLHQQLGLTQRTSDIWADQVKSMEAMKRAGMVTEAAVVQSKAQYYSIMSSIPDLEQKIAVTGNTLSLLLNTYPQKWEVASTLLFNLPLEIKDGMPLAYLAARPDVRAAERSMAMAYYRVNTARAAFYPGLNISVQGGFTNSVGGAIVNPGKWFTQLAGSLAAPIFSRGQNRANLKMAKINQEQALRTFEYTVLSAAADVSNAMTQYTRNAEKRTFVMQQIDNLEKSVEYTQTLLTLNQSTTYLEVLTAQSQLLSAQLSSLACEHAKITALIQLYQAVGGGR